jgi:hypothetical protein
MDLAAVLEFNGAFDAFPKKGSVGFGSGNETKAEKKQPSANIEKVSVAKSVLVSTFPLEDIDR